MTQQSSQHQIDDKSLRQGLWFVALAAFLYSAIHVGFRLLASDVLGEDDIIDNILVQDLRLAYDAFPRQPPLYDWVLWLVQRVTGPGVVGFLLIKYAALIATACLLYLSALRVLKDRLFAILTVESLALIYQISWRYHEGFTHEVGAMVAVMATMWLFLRMLDYGRLIDFAALGIVAGLGMLTEPAYTVFFVALLSASALQPAVRTKAFAPPIFLTLVLALAVASPYLRWFAAEPNYVSALLNGATNHFDDALRGLGDALRGPVAYLSPLLFILPIVFPRFVFVAWSELRRAPNQTADPDLPQLIFHAAVAALVLCITGALLFAIEGFAIHALMPLYLTSVIWLFSIAQRANTSQVYVGRFTKLAIAIAVIALVARLANMFILDPVCKKCRWGIPYAQLGVTMRDRGFETGTIVSIDRELAGNLRAIFPDAAVVTRRYPSFTPRDANLNSGKLAFVWGTQLSDAEAKSYLNKLVPAGHSLDEADLLQFPWRHIVKPDGYRISEWKLLIIDLDKPKSPNP